MLAYYYDYYANLPGECIEVIVYFSVLWIVLFLCPYLFPTGWNDINNVYIFIFIFLCPVCIAYVVKEIASFWGFSQ